MTWPELIMIIAAMLFSSLSLRLVVFGRAGIKFWRRQMDSTKEAERNLKRKRTRK